MNINSDTLKYIFLTLLLIVGSIFGYWFFTNNAEKININEIIKKTRKLNAYIEKIDNNIDYFNYVITDLNPEFNKLEYLIDYKYYLSKWDNKHKYATELSVIGINKYFGSVKFQITHPEYLKEKKNLWY